MEFLEISNRQKFLFSIITAILLILAWPGIGDLTPLLFIALVPLFLVIRNANHQSQRDTRKIPIFWFVWFSMFLFNTGTTWWVWNASAFGAIAAITLNSLFISLAVSLSNQVRKNLGVFRGDVALISFWISWEYFHLDWDLSWTWLNLGNGFATFPELIQWYEYTGVFGGTLWILISNVWIARWLKKTNLFELKRTRIYHVPYFFRSLFIIIIPVICSLYIFNKYQEKGPKEEVVVVQPNIDPYNEKFGGSTPAQQLDKMLQLASSKITPETKFVVFPETAIPLPFDEDDFDYLPSGEMMRAFSAQNPQVSIIIGASTYVVYGPKEKVSTTARTADDGTKYDYCNTAIFLEKNQPAQFYHKSKMVPGVEKMPFPAFFKNFQEFAFDLGGASGSLGSQDTRTVFTSQDSLKVAAGICYESVYGAFMGDFALNGAQAFFIITNDGWWGNTPGFKQHQMYAQIRAIEHRRAIARSANTGISCFINQKGQVIQKSSWWQPDALVNQIAFNSETTFYTKYGDILGRIALAFGALLLIMSYSRGVINKANGNL